MEPVVTAAGIGAGASLLGGMMSSSGARAAANTQRDLGIHAFMHDTAWRLKERDWFLEDRERALAEQLRQEGVQREFAQHGVRWRVEDAQAAGVHPLFALGGSGASFTPSAIGVMGGSSGASVNGGDFGASSRARAAEHMGRAVSDAGQSLARAVAAQETQDQQMLRLAQLRALEATAEKDFAIASRYSSEAALLRQQSVAPFPDTGDAAGWVRGGSGGGDLVHQGTPNEPGRSISPFFDRRMIEPSRVVSASSEDSSQQAGTSPMWKTYRYKDEDGRVMLMDLPAANDVGESLEPLAESRVLLLWTLNRNIAKYGQQWFVEFGKNFVEMLK